MSPRSRDRGLAVDRDAGAGPCRRRGRGGSSPRANCTDARSRSARRGHRPAARISVKPLRLQVVDRVIRVVAVGQVRHDARATGWRRRRPRRRSVASIDGYSAGLTPLRLSPVSTLTVTSAVTPVSLAAASSSSSCRGEDTAICTSACSGGSEVGAGRMQPRQHRRGDAVAAQRQRLLDGGDPDLGRPAASAARPTWVAPWPYPSALTTAITCAEPACSRSTPHVVRDRGEVHHRLGIRTGRHWGRQFGRRHGHVTTADCPRLALAASPASCVPLVATATRVVIEPVGGKSFGSATDGRLRCGRGRGCVTRMSGRAAVRDRRPTGWRRARARTPRWRRLHRREGPRPAAHR